MKNIMEAGYEAAAKGVEWWNNPHESGSVESYQWDQGHTRFRTRGNAMLQNQLKRESSQ